MYNSLKQTNIVVLHVPYPESDYCHPFLNAFGINEAYNLIRERQPDDLGYRRWIVDDELVVHFFGVPIFADDRGEFPEFYHTAVDILAENQWFALVALIEELDSFPILNFHKLLQKFTEEPCPCIVVYCDNRPLLPDQVLKRLYLPPHTIVVSGNPNARDSVKNILLALYNEVQKEMADSDNE